MPFVPFKSTGYRENSAKNVTKAKDGMEQDLAGLLVSHPVAIMPRASREDWSIFVLTSFEVRNNTTSDFPGQQKQLPSRYYYSSLYIDFKRAC